MTIIASAQSALTDSAVSSLDDDSREQPPVLTNPHTFGKAILCRKSSVRATQLEMGTVRVRNHHAASHWCWRVWIQYGLRRLWLCCKQHIEFWRLRAVVQYV